MQERIKMNKRGKKIIVKKAEKTRLKIFQFDF